MNRYIERVLVLILALSTPAVCIQPKTSSSGGLSSEELKNITSVECLEARQKDPKALCDNLVGPDGRRVVDIDLTILPTPSPSSQEVVPAEPPQALDQDVKKIVIKYTADAAVSSAELINGDMSGELSHYSYPYFKDAACNSDGAGFCDPYQAMTELERKNLTLELATLQKQNLVVCNDLVTEPLNERHLQPFYVAVALAQADGPDAEDVSLKQYAKLILSEWNVDEAFASTSQVTRCPNQALLLVLPSRNKATLFSESSDFISDQGATTIQRVVEGELKSGKSVAAAVLAGVKSAYLQLPNSVVEGEAMPPLEASGEVASEGNSESFSWLFFAERALFAFAVMALVMSIFIGLLVMFFAPGLAKGHRGYN